MHPSDGGARRPGGGNEIGERQGREPGVARISAWRAVPPRRSATRTHGSGGRASASGGVAGATPGRASTHRWRRSTPRGRAAERHPSQADAERASGRRRRRARERRSDAAHLTVPELDLPRRSRGGLAARAPEAPHSRTAGRPLAPSRAGRRLPTARCTRRGRAHPGRTPRAARRPDRCAPRGSPRRCGRSGRRRRSARRSGGSRSRSRMIAAGRRSKTSRTAVCDLLAGHLLGAEGLDEQPTGCAPPIA